MTNNIGNEASLFEVYNSALNALVEIVCEVPFN